MRKLFTLLTLSILSFGLLIAEPVSKEMAKKLAVNFYAHYAPTEITNYSVESSFSATYEGVVTYYTFNFKEGGFVIVSADDAARPVLGFSYESKFRKETDNPAAQAWFEAYKKQIKTIVNEKLDNAETLAEWNQILNKEFPKEQKEVDPLLTTEWGQSNGWDEFVPTGTPVGCVATAMAQVMNFWEHPTTGQSWHSYNHPNYGEQYADFASTTYDWANMPDLTASTQSALLSYHCGVAVDMNYAPSGSGAQTMDATFVLANYFKYDQTIDHAEKADYSDTDWENLLITELDAGRPVIYSGSDASFGGHAFVCDGYTVTANNYFHFNWGWEGFEDGYFQIGSLNTASGNFNNSNSIVYNIQPAAPGTEELLWTSKNTNFPNASTYPGYIDAVNQNVAWATGRDGSGGAADYRVYSRTIDAGGTWESKELAYGTAFSMIDGVSQDIAYIAAYGSGAGNSILRTTDGGDTWEVVLSGAGGASFFNVVHFFNENEGFVQGDPEGGEYELYTTTDGGDTWTRVDGADIPDPESSGEYGIVGLYDAMGDNIWYTTNNGYVYRSTDKGVTWTKHQIINTANTTNIDIAFASDGLTGLANVYEDGQPYSKFKTTDGGQSWTELTPSGNFYDAGISFVPGTTETFVSVGSDYQAPFMGISYSTDGGETWQEYADYYKNYQALTVDMVSVDKGYAGAFSGEYSGGIWNLGSVDPALITFSVTDGTDPLANAAIQINGELLYTDVNGEATYAPPAGTYDYTVSLAGYDQESGSVTFAGESITENVVLNAATITSNVTFNISDLNGPVEGATVSLAGAGELLTDGSGVAEFTNIADGEYQFAVSHPQYQDSTNTVTVAGSDVTVDISLIYEEFLVTFYVTDGNYDLQGAQIDIDGEIQTTNSEGFAYFELIPGDYDYSVTLGGYFDTTGTVTVVDQSIQEDVLMQQIPYPVTFTVTDAVTTDPIEDATVNIGGNGYPTDQNGQVVIDLVNDTYVYNVAASGYESFMGVATVAGAPLDIDVALTEETYSLTFEITDGTNPLSGATVEITGIGEETTNSNGIAIFSNLSNDTYDYTVSLSGYHDTANSVTINGQNETLEIALVPFTYAVTFTIEDESGPIEGAMVSLDGFTDMTTDIDGLAVFPAVPNGDYSFTVTMANYEDTTGMITVADEDLAVSIMLYHVGIGQEEASQFSVYPNPGDGVFFIRTKNQLKTLSVYNAIGSIVMQKKITQNAIIDLSGKAEGG